jgi:pimeloyl-ACP methyl ester carboxylesterase
MTGANLEEATILGVRTRFQRVCEGATPGVPPVLVLHGWGAHIEAVGPIVRSLGAATTVVAVDLPGFGSSSPPPEAWAVRDYAGFATAVAEHCGFSDRYSIVGHSFGARIAIWLASEPQPRIARMVLTGAAGIRPHRKPSYYGKVGMAKVGRAAACAGGGPGRRLQQRIRSRVASEDWLSAPETMRGTLANVLREDLSDRLPRVSVPTLLLWGEDDADTPLWMGRKMEALIPDAGLVVLPAAGHYAYADQAGQFNALANEFLITQLQTPAAAGHA